MGLTNLHTKLIVILLLVTLGASAQTTIIPDKLRIKTVPQSPVSGDMMVTVDASGNIKKDTIKSGSTTTHSLSFTYGFLGQPFSFNGSAPVSSQIDTTKLQTILNFFPKGDTRYLKSSTASTTYALQSTTISAGTGLTGGGSLAANRTISSDTSVLRTVANSYSLSGMQTKLNNYALLASPVLTGTPTAPTATVGTNTTQIATTAFVLANSSTVSGANPSATAGTSAVNGYAATFMRSDAAPKVDSTVFQTVANFFPKGDTRYAKISGTTNNVSSINVPGLINVNQSLSYSVPSGGALLRINPWSFYRTGTGSVDVSLTYNDLGGSSHTVSFGSISSGTPVTNASSTIIQAQSLSTIQISWTVTGTITYDAAATIEKLL